jgi:hypothetical protein
MARMPALIASGSIKGKDMHCILTSPVNLGSF